MSDDTSLIVRGGKHDSRVEEVRARLVLARRRTHAVLTEIRNDIPRRADWREWYRERPEIFIANAFFAGFLIGNRR